MILNFRNEEIRWRMWVLMGWWLMILGSNYRAKGICVGWVPVDGQNICLNLFQNNKGSKGDHTYNVDG